MHRGETIRGLLRVTETSFHSFQETIEQLSRDVLEELPADELGVGGRDGLGELESGAVVAHSSAACPAEEI